MILGIVDKMVAMPFFLSTMPSQIPLQKSFFFQLLEGKQQLV